MEKLLDKSQRRLLLLSALSATLCYLDLYGTMSLLWYSIWTAFIRVSKVEAKSNTYYDAFEILVVERLSGMELAVDVGYEHWITKSTAGRAAAQWSALYLPMDNCGSWLVLSQEGFEDCCP